MPSKRAVFESKDPSSASENTPGTRKGGDEAPIDKPSIQSRDLSHIDFNTEAPADDSNAVAEQASFYTRDSELGTDSPEEPQKKKYMGVERRKTNRRAGRDRRGDVRFDLDKSDRRQNQGRREDDHTPKYW